MGPVMKLFSTLLRSWSVLMSAAIAMPLPSVAVTFEDLYSVTVTPDPAAANQREAALQAAMAQLLIRVTGNRNAPLEPALQPLIAAPGDFLQSYGLIQRGETLVGFNGGQIERVLTELGQPFWGPERPLTLLWVAVDDGAGGRALLGADPAAELGAAMSPRLAELVREVREEIAAVADERGLPIAWPLLDLEDLSAVSPTDVWGGFDDRIVAASARYRADAVLIGRARPGVFGIEVEWLFVQGLQRQGLPAAGVRDGLDAAADRYAADLATIGGASATLLTVRNVLTPADYARVISYLERQSAFQTVDVESFDNGTLSLRVTARGDARVIERLLALGGVLRPAAATSSFGSLTFDVVGSGGSP